MDRITTIKLTKETKSRIEKLREYPRETYEEIMKKVLFLLNLTKSNPEKAQRRLKRLDKKLKIKRITK